MSVIVLHFVAFDIALAQEEESTQTLFSGTPELGFVWGADLKFNSIQGQTGSFIAFYGGALIDRTTLLAATIGGNVGHPTVNYSYFGLLTQYTYNPKSLIHSSAQVLFAFGTTKDYEQAKSSLFDNFMNTTGAMFYIVEPGVNMELNLSVTVRMLIGVSYRLAFGLDENSIHVERTKVTAKDFSGLNVNIGVKFGEY
jgi:hypothetical protein